MYVSSLHSKVSQRYLWYRSVPLFAGGPPEMGVIISDSINHGKETVCSYLRLLAAAHEVFKAERRHPLYIGWPSQSI